MSRVVSAARSSITFNSRGLWYSTNDHSLTAAFLLHGKGPPCIRLRSSLRSATPQCLGRGALLVRTVGQKMDLSARCLRAVCKRLVMRKYTRNGNIISGKNSAISPEKGSSEIRTGVAPPSDIFSPVGKGHRPFTVAQAGVKITDICISVAPLYTAFAFTYILVLLSFINTLVKRLFGAVSGVSCRERALSSHLDVPFCTKF